MKKCIILLIILACFQSQAAVNLLKITHENLDPYRYKITFILDRVTAFEVLTLENQDRIAIDFHDTSSSLTSASKILDGNFIKTIRKLNKYDTDLRIILELSPKTKLSKYYHSKGDFFLLTLELENNSISISKKKSEYVIVLDPGHGAQDAGTIGTTYKTLEKNITLLYAQTLFKELSKYPRYKVLMTRETDTFLSKEKRLENTKTMQADLLISIHADFNQNPYINGASVYTLSRKAMIEESANLSNKKDKNSILKNEQILLDNEEIANLLIDLVYKDTLNSSLNLAKCITNSLSASVNMLPKADKSSNFRILKGVDIPAVLVEIGYLSNPKEEKLLNSSLYRKKFIHALTQGINHYIDNLSK